MKNTVNDLIEVLTRLKEEGQGNSTVGIHIFNPHQHINDTGIELNINVNDYHSMFTDDSTDDVQGFVSFNL